MGLVPSSLRGDGPGGPGPARGEAQALRLAVHVEDGVAQAWRPVLPGSSESGRATALAALTGNPSIAGTGEAGALVELFADGGSSAVASAYVQSNGTWTLQYPQTTTGSYSLSVRQTDLAGNVSPSTSASATIVAGTAAALLPGQRALLGGDAQSRPGRQVQHGGRLLGCLDRGRAGRGSRGAGRGTGRARGPRGG